MPRSFDMMDVTFRPPVYFVYKQNIAIGSVLYTRGTTWMLFLRGYVKITTTSTVGTRNIKIVLTDGTAELKLAENITLSENSTGEFILTNPFAFGATGRYGLKVEDENSVDANDSWEFVGIGYPRLGDNVDVIAIFP